MYWIYNIPTWQLGFLTITVFLAIAIIGLIVFRPLIYHKFRLSNDTNEAVNGIFAGVGVLYGLLVGLVAVATWESYDNVNSLVDQEASHIAALYRDVSTLQQPAKTELQKDLTNYLNYIIEVAWPAHRQGQSSSGDSLILSRFLTTLSEYHTNSAEQGVFLAEVFSAYNRLVEARRMRLAAVDSGVPHVFWVVIVAGAIVNIFLTYLFHLPSLRTHIILTGFFAIFIGAMIFLIAAVDNPLRGEVSVKADAYISILNGLKNLDVMQSGGNR